jgi:glycosyltransferase involved in cell wall biosynthesis
LKRNQLEEFPFASILMPVRNEALYIEKSLNSVIRQNYPSDKLEVIISDGMSEDRTRSIINRIKEGNSQFNIKIIDNPGLIAPTALNTAMRNLKGSIIIRIDGHCEIAPDYVRNCVNHLIEKPIDGVGGPITTVGETPLSESIAVGMSSLFGVGGSAFRTYQDKAMLVDTVPFPAYTREIIYKAGPYDEELVRNQDDEFGSLAEGFFSLLISALVTTVEVTYGLCGGSIFSTDSGKCGFYRSIRVR